jgi:hypothetical protein
MGSRGKPLSLIALIKTAIEQEDYAQLLKLLKQWQKLKPNNPWFRFYVARWYEGTGKVERAEELYHKLLKSCHSPDILTQIRQGLQRLKQRVIDAELAAIAAAKAAPDGEAYGLFVIEPIAKEQIKDAALHFAEVMKTDAYSARLQLPTRAWKLFRTGKLGELRFYADALKLGQIPGFCLSLAQLETVQAWQVQYISELQPKLVIHCQDEQEKEHQIALDWREIHQCVEGMIPLFEESLEKNARGKTYYKTKVLDYAQFLDLHLGDRQIILRLNDQNYQFKQGFSFFDAEAHEVEIEQHSIRLKWNKLKQDLTSYLAEIETWSDFKTFAGNAADFPELLRKITPQVNLFRLEEHKQTHWDPAWQLYSTTIFAKKAQEITAKQARKN